MVKLFSQALKPIGNELVRNIPNKNHKSFYGGWFPIDLIGMAMAVALIVPLVNAPSGLNRLDAFLISYTVCFGFFWLNQLIRHAEWFGMRKPRA